MADFLTAYKKTVFENEGGYNPGDGEAETYAGIDRSVHPAWEGWKYIDSIKKGKSVKQVNALLAANIPFQKQIQNFYLVNYWNPVALTQIKDQQVANILFDDSVNPCEISVNRVMQEAANQCGVHPPLVVDGQIGPVSISAINAIAPKTYYNAVAAIRSFHYNNEVIAHPKQRQWLNVWLKRLVPYQNVA